MTGKISIGIPTFNRMDKLKRTVDSVLSQLYENFEIIISDNCSTDNTWSYLTELKTKYPDKIKINRNDINIGMLKNWEKCVDMADGVFFILISDDDWIEDDAYLSKMVNTFAIDSGFVFSNINKIKRDAKIIKVNKLIKKEYKKEELIYKFFNGEISIYPSSTLYRLNDVKEFRYLYEAINYAADVVLWLRILQRYEYVNYASDCEINYTVSQGLSGSSFEIKFSDNKILSSIINLSNYNIKIKRSVKYFADAGLMGCILYKYKEKKLISLNDLKIVYSEIKISNAIRFLAYLIKSRFYSHYSRIIN